MKFETQISFISSNFQTLLWQSPYLILIYSVLFLLWQCCWPRSPPDSVAEAQASRLQFHAALAHAQVEFQCLHIQSIVLLKLTFRLFRKKS
jgi:hypothetical protein